MPPTLLEHDLNEILSVVAGLLADHAKVSEINYLPGGYSNDNYRIQVGSSTYILRICRYVPDSVDAEKAYLALPMAPRLINYDESTGHMITEFVEGPLLATTPFGIDESVSFLQHLHCNIPKGIRSHDPTAVALGHFSVAHVQNEISRFLLAASWKPRNPCGCHNDLNPYNVVRADRTNCVTLDWEFAGDNEPLFDLVNLCHGLNYSDSETELCASKYCGDGFDTEFLLLTRLLFQAREHSWALAQAARGNDRPEIQAQARMARSEFHRLKTLYGQ